MGSRTVVLLNNDMRHWWQTDPELGKKIAHDMNYVHDKDRVTELSNLGKVIECIRAGRQTLMMTDGLHGTPVAYSFWHPGQTHDEAKLDLLRDMADRLGYRISKKPEVK